MSSYDYIHLFPYKQIYLFFIAHTFTAQTKCIFDVVKYKVPKYECP